MNISKDPKLLAEARRKLKSMNIKVPTVKEVLEMQKREKESGLVYALENEIYLHRKKSKDILICERPDWVRALAVCDNKLYDGGDYCSVCDTLTGDIIAKRSNVVRALAVCDNKLYDGGYYKIVCDTLTGDIIAKRSRGVWALAVCDNKLYDSGGYQTVCDTLTGARIMRSFRKVCALAVCDNKLYDGGNYKGICDTLTGKIIAKRSNWVCALAVCDNKLYDGGFYKKIFVTNVKTKKSELIAEFDKNVTAMCVVNGFVVKDILKLKGEGV